MVSMLLRPLILHVENHPYGTAGPKYSNVLHGDLLYSIKKREGYLY